MSLLLALVLSQTIVQPARRADGGSLFEVTCPTCPTGSGGPSGGGQASISLDGGSTFVWAAGQFGVQVDGGSIAVTNWPASQTVEGTVGVRDFGSITVDGGQLGAMLHGWDPNVGAWVRVETDPTNADAVPQQDGGLLDTDAHLRLLNPQGTFDRWRGSIDGGAFVEVRADISSGINNGTAPPQVQVMGVQLRDTTTATAGTVGQVGSAAASLDHVLYTRQGGPVTWTCGVNAVAASLTQCQAAPGAGVSLYITSINVQTTTTTSGTYAIQYGTGSNCGTGTAALFPVSGTANRFNAPITTSAMATIYFPIPLKAAANNAICLIGVATNTISAQITGFTAP